MSLNIEYRQIALNELHPNMLQYFNRYQVVAKDWVRENNKYVLVSNPHIENWNEDKKTKKVCTVFETLLKNNGVLFGAFDDGKLIGFSGIDGILIGSKQQYLELTELHISCEYRSMGIGRSLFLLCVESALKFECTKLYIVASSSEESQRFYRNMGCVEAEELIPSLFENCPNDVHMEYVINQ
jgi:ribosomal protein S18 acetylase RimI-like enzyme